MTTISRDPKALARELNQFITDGGGQPIEGLDGLDPKQLISIRDGLKQFLDKYDNAKAQDPEIAKLADGEAVKSLRQLAQIASQKVDQAALGNGTGSGVQLSGNDVATGQQQIDALKAQIGDQKALNAAQRGSIQQDINTLQAKAFRSPAEEALLQGKRSQLAVLQGVDQNLDLKAQGLDAASFAMKDGVITPSEQRDLQTIARATQSKDAVLQRVGAQADQLVGRVQGYAAGPLAANGSNFDPMALNTVAAAAIMASAIGGQGQAGVFAPPAGMNNIVRALANGTLGQPVNQTGTGRLDQPSRIGDDANLGTDASLASLGAVGGGGGFFEDRVFAIMCKVVEDFQKQIEDRLNKLEQQAKDAEKGGDSGGGGGGGKGGGIGGLVGGIAGSVVGGPVGGMIGKAAGVAIGGAVDGGGGGGGGAGGAGGADGGKNGSESRNIEFEKIKYDMQKLSQMQQAMSNILNTMDELAKNAIHHIKSG